VVGAGVVTGAALVVGGAVVVGTAFAIVVVTTVVGAAVVAGLKALVVTGDTTVVAEPSAMISATLLSSPQAASTRAALNSMAFFFILSPSTWCYRPQSTQHEPLVVEPDRKTRIDSRKEHYSRLTSDYLTGNRFGSRIRSLSTQRQQRTKEITT
jgi:hypothetical protein